MALNRKRRYATRNYNNSIIDINNSMVQANQEFANNNNNISTLNSAITNNTYYRPNSSNTYNSRAPYGNDSGGGRGNYADSSIPTFNITYEPPASPTLSPISYNPTDPSSYGWDTGATLLAGYGNEAPSTRNIVYNNEFSPESTMSMANDIYNEYYAPMVQQQQEMNTRDYQRAANRSIASVESDRAQIQLQNQAAREATAANTLYQQQQQAAAFQQTLDARNLELQNKIQDYENAWEEVATYGYVVTENTANLLGIDPGQQLTTLQYKQVMSGIANSVADAEAQKVQLAQQQDNLNLRVQELQQEQEQFRLNYEQNQQSIDNNLYTRLTDMLQRYDNVTPEMSALARQLGINLTVDDPTSKYWTTREQLENMQNQLGTDIAPTITQGQQYIQNQLIASQIQDDLTEMTGSSGVKNPSTFSNWILNLLNSGMGPEDIKDALDAEEAGTYNFGWFQGKNRNNLYNTIDTIYRNYISGVYNRY